MGVEYDLLALRCHIFEYSRETFCRYSLKYLEPARYINDMKWCLPPETPDCC